LLHETDRFKTLWNAVYGVVAPFAIGATLAFIFNVPLRAIERNLTFIRQEELRRTVAIVLTLIAIVLVIYGVFALLVPQISDTIMILIPKLTDFFLRMETMAEEFMASNPELLEWVYANTGLSPLTGQD
jgi:predicted PurR-regulated permease PerM